MSDVVKYLGTGTDELDLALKHYSGKFIEAPRSSVFLYDTGLPVIDRRMAEGKSMQFLQNADSPTPFDFEPGDEIMGQDGAVNEVTATVDNFIVAARRIGLADKQYQHFDYIGKLAPQHKRKIEQLYDKRIFTVGLLAARDTSVTKNGLAVHSGGNRVTRDDESLVAAYPASSTGAARFREDLRSLRYEKDIDNIGEDSYLWVPPYMRQVVLYDNTAQVFSEDYVHPGTNEIMKRQVRLLEGFKLVGFPNTTSAGGPFPNENIVGNRQSKYDGNFTIGASNGLPVALALSADNDGGAAIALLTFNAITPFVIWQPERLSWLVGSYIFCGANKLNPWCAGSIEVIDTD